MTSELFPRLEPPPGGLARLRHRLTDEPRRARRRTLVLVGLGAAALALLVPVVHRPRPALELATVKNFAALAALGLAEVPDEPITQLSHAGVPLAVARAPGDAVAFYFVGPRN